MYVPYTTLDGRAYTAGDGTILVLPSLALITDRTAQDFVRWLELRNKGWANMTEEERVEWSGDMKVAYNASDLNRVGTVINYLWGLLEDAGYTANKKVLAKADWAEGEIPTAADLSLYLSYVEAVRSALAQYQKTPKTPADVGSLNYQDANDIEQIMIDVDQLITNMLAARYFCGDLYSGEV